MSAYRKLTETLRDAVARKAERALARDVRESWSRALALLEEELRAMGDDE